MENQTVKINVEDGVKELIIRQGESAPALLPRKGGQVKGLISVPYTHLKNLPANVTSPDRLGHIPLEHSYIKVNRELRVIALEEDVCGDGEGYYQGMLELDPIIKKFKINSGDSFTTFELADLIKMNRSFFETKDVAMRLVGELRNLKVKVDKDVEAMDDKRGNKRALIAQAVETNIPESFNMTFPVFKGEEPGIFSIEINISPDDFSCTLISADLNDLAQSRADEIIDAELAKIKELHPELRIFEI